jgi:hypothetical protein
MTTWRMLAGAMVMLLAAGCSVKTDLQGNSAVRINPLPGRLPAPTAAAPAAPTPVPDGRFSGTGTLTASVASGCQRQRPFNNLVVSGTRVRWQGFRGTIDQTGFARLQSGDRFLYGFFDGPRFAGHYCQPHPDCTWDVVLTHQG